MLASAGTPCSGRQDAWPPLRQSASKTHGGKPWPPTTSSCVVPALALVDVEEDLLPFFRINVALEHAGHVAMNQLVINDAIGGGMALDLPGQVFVRGELAAKEKSQDRLGTRRSRDGSW